MDQTLLDMKYAELVRHAKDLGITFASSKPKKDQIIESIAEYHKSQTMATSSKSETRKARKPKVDYSEAEKTEPKEKKAKKVKSKSSEGDEAVVQEEEVKPKKKKSNKSESTEVGQEEEAAKVVKKKKKVKKASSVEAPLSPQAPVVEESVTTPVKKVKKSSKIKANLKCTETDEMKRVRKSIMEKKQAKISKSNKDLAGSEQSEAECAAEAKKEKRIKFSEKDVGGLCGDVSGRMKRRIVNKKKKSSSPTLKPAVVARRTSDRQRGKEDEMGREAEKSLLAETNEIIEGQEICDEQFQLQLDSEDDSRDAVIEQKQKQQDECQRETAPPHTRRSIAFTINASATTPAQECQVPKSSSFPRRSIAFTIDPKTTTTTPTRKSILTRPAAQSATTTPVTHLAAKRRSIAFTIDTTPRSNHNTRPAASTHPRKSIVIEVPVVPEASSTDMMTDDEASMDKTYPVNTNHVTSPIVSCKAFYKPNATLDITNDIEDEPEKKPEAAVAAAPVGRARIVRPTEVKKVVETVVEKNRANEVVVKKVVEVVRREAGPRITKPAEATAENSSKLQQVSGKKVGTSVGRQPKSVVTGKKVPDFKAIHERNFNKSEDITEAGKRVVNRHNQLFGGQGKAAAAVKSQAEPVVASEQEPSMVSNLMSHATNLLKRITPFGSSEDTENTTTPNKVAKPALAKSTAVASHIPKIKIGFDKIERPPFMQASSAAEREPFSTSLKPRTPLGTRTLNSMRTPSRSQQVQATTPCHSKNTPKTPNSNNKPKASSLLLSASKKPVLSKPFHFQNQNLESNINFGTACQFGTSTGKTPLKDSAFQRRKSYNPRDSIGRPLTYNPHQGRLRPLETAKLATQEDSLTVRAAAAIASQEKRKSILGVQKNLEKDKLDAKRRLVRNNEMDRPRIL